MATFVKFQQFVEDVGLGVHNLASHTLKVLLTNDAPSASADAVRADLTSELSGGNGYTAGGATVGSVTYSQTSGTATLAGADVTITASGGSLGPFRYAVLYNDTPTSPADPLISYWDRGDSVTLADGESVDIDFGPSILTLA
jgi:hypothetical protein